MDGKISSIMQGLPDDEKTFYRSVFGCLEKLNISSTLVFDPERILDVCLAAGIPIGNSTMLTSEKKSALELDDLPGVDSDVPIQDFLFSSAKNQSVLIEYCKGVY